MLTKLPCGDTVRLIGDPHLGKKFEAGVPLARRGDREKLQMKEFKEQLADKADWTVVMGDLFDHPYVAYEVVLETYKALVNEATSSRDKRIIVMAGNHDVPRNLEAIGAFHLLESMIHMRADNLMVTRHAQLVGPIAVFPWQWEMKAIKQIDLVRLNESKPEVALGHWDLKQFGESDAHMAPTKMIRKYFGGIPIYSGHFHVPGTYKIEGEDVICTGSMQPYSHGEDPNGDLYVTLTLDELGEQDLKDKCVRVLLREGEELPSDIDCLALTAKRVTDEEDTNTPVGLTEFNWSEIVERKLSDVPKPAKDFIMERLVV